MGRRALLQTRALSVVRRESPEWAPGGMGMAWSLNSGSNNRMILMIITTSTAATTNIYWLLVSMKYYPISLAFYKPYEVGTIISMSY